MKTQNAYIYDEITKEFLYETEVQQDVYNPEEYIMPDNCTLLKPMDKQEEKTPCFIVEEWVLLTDHRGKPEINLLNLEIRDCDYIGEAHDNYQFITEEIKWDYYNDTDKYKVIDGVFTDISDTEEYKQIKTARRKAAFESQFIETSMKDSQGNNAYYRQVPHGYANAPQTIELADKYVRDAQGMTEQIAALLIFYQKPDFTKAEECEEEWLIAHQFNPPSNMSLQQWRTFEFDFQQRWITLKHKTSNDEN